MPIEKNPKEWGQIKMLAYKEFLVSITHAGKPKFGCGLSPAGQRIPYISRKNKSVTCYRSISNLMTISNATSVRKCKQELKL